MLSDPKSRSFADSRAAYNSWKHDRAHGRHWLGTVDTTGRATGRARRLRRSDRQLGRRAWGGAGRSLGLKLRAGGGQSRAACPGALVVVCPRDGDVDDFCDDLAVFWIDRLGKISGLGNRAGRARHPRRSPRRSAAGSEAAGCCNTRTPRRQDTQSHRHQHSGTVAAGAAAGVAGKANPAAARGRRNRSCRTAHAGWPKTVFKTRGPCELPGEFSPRGGIIDVFAPDWFHPVRIELFGDTIESIRQFEVSTQRSLESLEAIEITALGSSGSGFSGQESGASSQETSRCSPAHHAHSLIFRRYLPPQFWFLLIEPHEMQEEARHYRQRLDRPQDVHDLDDTLAAFTDFPRSRRRPWPAVRWKPNANCGSKASSVSAAISPKCATSSTPSGWATTCHLVCPTEAEVERLREIFGTTQARRQPANCISRSADCSPAFAW